MRLWPRSIRWQMLAGLLLLEVLSIVLFAALLLSEQGRESRLRTRQRLANQATSLAVQASEAIQQGKSGWVGMSVRTMGDSPNVSFAKVTDPSGNVLFASKGGPENLNLEAGEAAEIPKMKQDRLEIFTLPGNRLESAAPIYAGGNLLGFAWVQNNPAGAAELRDTVVRSAFSFGIIWIAASVLLVLLASEAITRPLEILHRGTKDLMISPAGGNCFPLPVVVNNEFGDLIEAFNRMVASIDEQRSGLNDTLSLLDSMLANAPIGLAFFDRRGRFVRVNQVFAEMTGVPLSRHLGRTLPELFPQHMAQELEEAVQRVFRAEEPVHNLELSGIAEPLKRSWTWLVSAYPVRTTPSQVRWAGLIVLDASERKRSEEALRRSEKLAATGRLAASISHEINNPLEAITNLLFLLRNFCQLEGPALNYVEMAEHEARRITEITQQTLRFYRQPTQPARTNMGDLLDSVLSLFLMRLNTLNINLEREYDPSMDLYCFGGEVRQVVANLVGNAIDAMTGGGRMIIKARKSRRWTEPGEEGVRITVADTGTGIEANARAHIFEAFFTTKEVTGTGLGLWVSHEIILKHQGLVHVRSRPASAGGPSGTVFQIFFPDNQELAEPTLQAEVAEIEKVASEPFPDVMNHIDEGDRAVSRIT
jgi:PAS domain S-box-containing protein